MVKNISVKPNHKSAFISVLFWGMLANIYMFTNKISFHDDMGALFGVGTTYASGRWLLGILGDFVKKFYGNYSLPVLGGFLSLFFIALAAIILVDVFEIHSRVNSILAGAIMVLFPGVVSVFAYMYTAPYYYFALLMTVAAVYMIKCWGRIGGLGGVILIGSAMGIYQAYFPVAVATLLGILIIRGVSEHIETGDIIKTGIWYLLLLIASLVFYFIVTKISLYVTSTQLGTHRGVNNMGKTPLALYPSLIKTAYMRWWELMFTINSISCSPFAMILYRIFTAVFSVIAIGDIIAVFRQDRWKGILLLIMFLLFPVAANLMELMAPNYVVERMLYGFVMVFLLLLSLSEKLTEGWYFCGIKSVVTLVMIGFISVYVYYANVEYFRMDFLQSQAKSYFTTLISQIKSADGYKAGMPVVFIGEHSSVDLDRSFEGIYYNAVPYSDYGEVGDLLNSYTWTTYMRRWCGFSPEIENENNYVELPEVEAMSTYPNEGSIKVVDDVLVVKLSGAELKY